MFVVPVDEVEPQGVQHKEVWQIRAIVQVWYRNKTLQKVARDTTIYGYSGGCCQPGSMS